MKQQSTHIWAYRIVSKKQLNFYHVLQERLTPEEILQNTSYGDKIKKERDGSLTLTLWEEGHLQETIAQLKMFFADVENNAIETPYAYYSSTSYSQATLKEWYFSIMGSVALILLQDPILQKVFSGKWEFTNSSINTLYLEPYTFVFTKEYVKVVHPVRPQNYEIRERAEQLASNAFSKIFTRIHEAYPSFEGVAILSFAQDKTGLSKEKIASLIEEKSQQMYAGRLSV